MVPGYDCAASVLLCAEDNAAVLGLDEEGEESSWPAGATPPRDAAAGGVAVDGYLMDFPLQSDDCIEALVEREEEHMPVEGYLQKLQRRHGPLDLGTIRRDAIDWIWKVRSPPCSLESCFCADGEILSCDVRDLG
jgi:cyclin D1/2/4, plant